MVFDPKSPLFNSPLEGDVTTWYTMQLTNIANDVKQSGAHELTDAIAAYEARDAEPTTRWN